MASTGYTLVVEHRLLITVSSFIVKHRLWGAWASVFVAHGRGCPARGIQDLPGPVEPVSPVSAGGLSTTGPPRKFGIQILERNWCRLLFVLFLSGFGIRVILAL